MGSLITRSNSPHPCLYLLDKHLRKVRVCLAAHTPVKREVKSAPTVEGKVTDESGRLVAGGNIQERQQLVPELAQFAALLPRCNSWNPCSNREIFTYYSTYGGGTLVHEQNLKGKTNK